MLAVFAFGHLGALASATITKEPVTKIIEMLNDLAAKSEAEGKEEELNYEKFEYWCANSEKALNNAIQKEEETIAELESTIEGLTAQEETLTEEIDDLTDELTDLGEADTKAKHERDEEAKLYRAADADFTSTITAVDNALTAMETAQTNTDTGFLQTNKKVRFALALASSQSLTEHQHSTISAFLQSGAVTTATTTTFALADRPDFLSKGNGSAHVKKYSFKSNSVIELLKELKQKFEEDKLQNVKEETNAINAYELAKESRQDLRDAKTKSKTAKTTERTQVQTDLATAKDDLKVMEGDLKDDSNTLDQTMKACALKKTEWEQRSSVRSLELEALAAAAKILAKATDLRTERPNNPVPPPSPYTGDTSEGATAAFNFLELEDPIAKAVRVLQKAARAQHSKALDLLARQLSVGGPFNKVNNMIEKMIFRLMDEQKDEDNHKNWCDKELEKTNTSLYHKLDKMSDLNTKIGIEKARETTLTTEIGDDRGMIATIEAHLKESKEIREIGKKENAKAVKDAKEAQTIIADAIAVIEEYYKESGMLDKEAWEFAQVPSMTANPVKLPPTPSTWSSSYTGVADPSDAGSQPKGIVSVLKATAADFATMEGDTLAQEATDQSTYEDDVKACTIEKAGRETSVEMKTNEKKRVGKEIARLNDELKDFTEQHDATQQYLDDLQPACVDGSSTYDARKAARTKEIEALRDAQNILAKAFDETTTTAAGSVLPTFLQAAPTGSSFLQKRRR